VSAKSLALGHPDQFGQVLRHRCRNPRCRSRLPAPVSNQRRAFCSKGCASSFYRHRCSICERPIEQPKGGGRRSTCNRAKCRNARRYQASFGAKPFAKEPDFMGVTAAPIPHRAWRTIAGLTLSPSAFHCATLAPDRRTAAELTRRHKQFYRGASATLIGLTDPPINILGGFKFRNAPTVEWNRLVPPEQTIPTIVPDLPIPADLSVPDFLRRLPKARGTT
jgi:hypothetical protein